jgi:SAM-dependent methyltransferase
MTESIYARQLTEEEIQAGVHRALVGGFWEEIGALQLNFLVKQGLTPSMTLLDIGCGAFRGGVHLIRYLDAGNYYGVDQNKSLLRAGVEIELAVAGLRNRLPVLNIVHDEKFDFESLYVRFDIALAQSVFSHIDMNQIRLCLTNLAPVMEKGGRFYATFFERPPGYPLNHSLEHPPMNVETFSAFDPYHYAVSDFEFLANGLPWTIENIGDWGHPRGQKMLAFYKQD